MLARGRPITTEQVLAWIQGSADEEHREGLLRFNIPNERAVGIATVARPVHAGTPGHVPPADVLTRSDPDDLGIRGREGDFPDRVARLVVEDRGEGHPGVRRLPDTSGADPDHEHDPLVGGEGLLGGGDRRCRSEYGGGEEDEAGRRPALRGLAPSGSARP